MIYAVIDTNVIVSALITKNPKSATVKVMEAVLGGDVVPIYNGAVLDEYSEVLRRKKFHLDGLVVDSIINYFITFGQEERPVKTSVDLPDEDDRVFYELSLSTDNAFLVTGNLKHYPHSERIILPSAFVKLL